MKTLVICGYSGVGKTEFARKHYDAIDIDSANMRNCSNFYQTYLDRILQNVGKYKYILVSTHPEVRDALVTQNLSVVLVYPDRGLKNEYLMRYLMRGNSYMYAKYIDTIWDNSIFELEADGRFPAIVLSKGKFLSDCTLDLYFKK